MDGLLVLLALAAIGAVILGPIGFFAAMGHGGRLRIVERALDDVRQRLVEAERQLATGAGATAAQARARRRAAAPATKRADAEDLAAPPPPSRPAADLPPPIPVAPPPPAEAAEPPLPPETVAAAEARNRRRARLLLALRLKKGSARVGRYGSAASRPASARCCSSATPPSRAISAPARASRSACCSPSSCSASANGCAAPRAPCRSSAAPRRAPMRRRSLTGAGVVAAFGSVYAAHALYGFIGSGPGVPGARRGRTGVAGARLAARAGARRSRPGRRRGRAAARFLRSSLAVAGRALPVPVAVAAYALARLRRWLWLALATAGGGFAWSFLLAGQSHDAHALDVYHAALAMLVLQAALAAAFMAVAPHRGGADEDAGFDPRGDRRSRRIFRPRRAGAGQAVRRVRLRRLVDRRGRRAGRIVGDHRRCRGDGRLGDRARRRAGARRARRLARRRARRGRSIFTRWSPIGAGRRRSIRRASSASRSPPGSASPRSPPGGCCAANVCRRRRRSSTPARRA